jgi:butyryl-CoA dehydrogenase
MMELDHRADGPGGPALAAALRTLAHQAEQADQDALWPTAALDALKAAQVPRWSVAAEYEGWGLELVQRLHGYEAIGQACLTTAFILSQREAAVRRLSLSADRPVAAELLPPLARGELWASVGVAQLSTSRQHLPPTLKARRSGGGLVLEGYVPWVTGAAQSDVLILGAVDGLGRPLLVAVDAAAPGLCIDPPFDLAALRGSCTTSLTCEGVTISAKDILEDHPERIQAGDSAGGLTTSCLALALAAAALEQFQREAELQPDLQPTVERLNRRLQDLRATLFGLAQASADRRDQAAELRAAATEAALRTTQATLTACKGSGFMRPHPAQRWARQALFLLVWSCPRSVSDRLLARLAAESTGV